MARNSWDTAELEITHVSSYAGGELPYTTSTPDVMYLMEFRVGAFQAPFSGVVDPEQHYLLRQRGEFTVSAPLSNGGPVELYYAGWQDDNTLIAEISPGQTLTIPFDRSDPGNTTIQGSGSWVFELRAWATIAPAQLTLESAHTTLTLTDEPPPPPAPDGPATWVPLADAGVDFDFDSQTPNVRLEGSTVVCDGPGDPVDFVLYFDPPQRVRLTVLSYTSTADEGGVYEYPAEYSFWNWDPYVNLYFENTAHPAPVYDGDPYEIREGFIPSQNESLVPVQEVYFGPAQGANGYLQDRYEILIEIDGEAPSYCFWTDLVGVTQVCGAPGPAPEPEPADGVKAYLVGGDSVFVTDFDSLHVHTREFDSVQWGAPLYIDPDTKELVAKVGNGAFATMQYADDYVERTPLATGPGGTPWDQRFTRSADGWLYYYGTPDYTNRIIPVEKISAYDPGGEPTVYGVFDMVSYDVPGPGAGVLNSAIAYGDGAIYTAIGNNASSANDGHINILLEGGTAEPFAVYPVPSLHEGPTMLFVDGLDGTLYSTSRGSVYAPGGGQFRVQRWARDGSGYDESVNPNSMYNRNSASATHTFAYAGALYWFEVSRASFCRFDFESETLTEIPIADAPQSWIHFIVAG